MDCGEITVLHRGGTYRGYLGAVAGRGNGASVTEAL